MIADKERIRFLEAALAAALKELQDTYFFETMFPEGNDGFASFGGRSRPPSSSSKKANREK